MMGDIITELPFKLELMEFSERYAPYVEHLLSFWGIRRSI